MDEIVAVPARDRKTAGAHDAYSMVE
jgi:hypothetical protein